MLPCMNAELINSLSRSGISSVQELLDIPKAALQNVTGNFPASRLYQVKSPNNFLIVFMLVLDCKYVLVYNFLLLEGKGGH